MLNSIFIWSTNHFLHGQLDFFLWSTNHFLFGQHDCKKRECKRECKRSSHSHFSQDNRHIAQKDSGQNQKIKRVEFILLSYLTLQQKVIWRAIECILTKRAPSWIQTRKRLRERRDGILGSGCKAKRRVAPPHPLFLHQHGRGSTRSRVYTAVIREHTENACTVG